MKTSSSLFASLMLVVVSVMGCGESESQTPPTVNSGVSTPSPSKAKSTPSADEAIVREFDMILSPDDGILAEGVCELKGNRLRLAFGMTDSRVLQFETQPDDQTTVMTLERQGEGTSIEGTWKVVAAESDGAPTDRYVGDEVTFTADQMKIVSVDGSTDTNGYRLGGVPKTPAAPSADQADAIAMLRSLDGEVTLNGDGKATKASLFYASVTDDQMAKLAQLTTLESLELNTLDGMTAENLTVISHLTSLKSLTLASRSMTADWLTPLASLTQLEELNLATSWSLDDGLFEHIRHLGNLSTLNLESTRITDEGLKQIAGLKKLQHLDLTGLGMSNDEPNSNITDAAIEHLAVLENLKSLHVKWTRITAEGAARLNQSLPDCEVSGLAEHGT